MTNEWIATINAGSFFNLTLTLNDIQHKYRFVENVKILDLSNHVVGFDVNIVDDMSGAERLTGTMDVIIQFDISKKWYRKKREWYRKRFDIAYLTKNAKCLRCKLEPSSKETSSFLSDSYSDTIKYAIYDYCIDSACHTLLNVTTS